MRRVGVLALQGAVAEHMTGLEAAGALPVAVRKPEDLMDIRGLIIPGGESTTISRLLLETGLHEAVKSFAGRHPVMATCAGLILCARHLQPADERVTPLGLMDITVCRNGFGRQQDSFETELDVEGAGQAVPAVFIRAPYIHSAGPGVRVLATLGNRIVMARQDRITAMAFHPELTDDRRILRSFLSELH